MKRTKLLSIALSAIALLALVGCSNEPKIKTVLNPTVAKSSDKALTVDKVIITDSMTIIDFAYKFNDIGNYLFTPTTAYIVANGQKYGVMGSKNMLISESEIQSEVIHFRTTTFSLIFPPIPFDTDSISYYEYDPKTKQGGWYVKGISLDSKSTSIAYKDKKDSEIYAKNIKAYIEEEQKRRLQYEEQWQRKIEESQKPYKCSICGKRYYQESEKKHCESMHGLSLFGAMFKKYK